MTESTKTDLFELLRCPESHQRLVPITQSWLDRLNQQIERGELKDVSGRTVETAFDGALVTEDDRYLYPVRNGIACMHLEDRIELEE